MMDQPLTSYTQRREIRDEINRLIRIYIEKCSCGAPQPSWQDLKLDQHRPDCEFLIQMEDEQSQQQQPKG